MADLPLPNQDFNLPELDDSFLLPDLEVYTEPVLDFDQLAEDFLLPEFNSDPVFELDKTQALSPDMLSPTELDDLFTQAAALSDVERSASAPQIEQALGSLGMLPMDDLHLMGSDEPFFHEESPAAFWFGVLQPDPEHNPEHAVAGILAMTPGDEGFDVDFAPFASGSVIDCTHMAATLVETAQEHGLEKAFDEASALSIQHQEQPFTREPDNPVQLDLDL